MNNTNQKLTSPIDVGQIKSAIAGQRQSGAPPTIIIRSSADEGEQGRLKLLERIVKTELLVNILLVLIVAVSLYVSFVLRFDILKYFNKNAAPIGTESVKPADKTGTLNFDFRVVAAAKESDQPDSPDVYINRQGVDLDKAFQVSSPSARLTTYGRLKNEVIGFLPYWIVPNIDQIDTRAISAVSYFGLEVDGNGEIIKYDVGGRPIEAWTYLQKDKNLENFINKLKNNKLKVYLTLKNFNQDNIVALTTSAKARENFISSAIFLMNSKSLDGLNIDFEYIGTPAKQVRDGFSTLIIDLYKAMKQQYPGSILTIDTFVDAASASRLHDVPVLAQNSDGLVIMGYDFHTPNSSIPGPVAPMEGAGLSIKGLMASYLDKAPAEKLILGVPYYGYDWPVKQTGSSFEVIGVSQQVNVLPYGEIAEATRNTRILWDENAQAPWYSYQDSETKQSRVVYFENVRSLGAKYDFVKQNKMQGIAIWALGFDGKRTEFAQMLIDKFAE